jgi:hypothetical protein
MVLGVVGSGRLGQMPETGHEGRIGSGQLPTLDRLRIGSGQLPTRPGAWLETRAEPRWAAAETAWSMGAWVDMTVLLTEF